MTLEDTDAGTLARYFDYLDLLRESGEVNMLGAAPYLAAAMQLGQGEARAIVLIWAETFSRETTPLARAEAAIAHNAAKEN